MSRIDQLCCVSVKICCDEGKAGGSGTIISDGVGYYVMTAAHCISKSTTEFYTPKEIQVTSYAKKDTTKIKVLEVDSRSDINDNVDFALLKIEDPHISYDFYSSIKCCDDIIDGEQYFFYGYGGPEEFANGRLFNLVRNGKDRWHLADDPINNQNKKALNLMEGNSGSGVFFQRLGIFYCVGYVKKLLDEEGTFNDVIVFPTSRFDNVLPSNTKEANLFKLVENWTKKESKILSEKLKSDYRTNNVQYLNNLERKINVLYPHQEEAKLKLDRQLEFYLEGLTLNIELQKSSKVYQILKQKEKEAFENFVEDRTSYFESNTTALNDMKSIKNSIREIARKVLPIQDNSSLVDNDYANYIIAEKLLNCSLDYNKDE